MACPVRVEDMAVHPSGDYPDKVKAPGVCAPVYEVHEDRGRRLLAQDSHVEHLGAQALRRAESGSSTSYSAGGEVDLDPVALLEGARGAIAHSPASSKVCGSAGSSGSRFTSMCSPSSQMNSTVPVTVRALTPSAAPVARPARAASATARPVSAPSPNTVAPNHARHAEPRDQGDRAQDPPPGQEGEEAAGGRFHDRAAEQDALVVYPIA